MTNRRAARGLGSLVVILALAVAPPLAPTLRAEGAIRSAATIERVSLSTAGVEANDGSEGPTISGDGRYVAFQSWATNLVAGDDTNSVEVFLRDRQTRQTTRLAVPILADYPNMNSQAPALSSDGRLVAFESGLESLVVGDDNNMADIFVRDHAAGLTELVSVPAIGRTANRWSWSPSLSGDGRYVAFASWAGNLVPVDRNGKADVFVFDRQTRAMVIASVSSAGVQADNSSGTPALSGDGSCVAFASYGEYLVDDDDNWRGDIFVHCLPTGATERVSVSSSGEQADNDSLSPAISADGRYVAFYSTSTNLVASDTNGVSDVFVHDRHTGQTERVSVGPNGAQANDSSRWPSLSADGRYVAFASGATNLVAGDANGKWDVFIRDRQTGENTLASVSAQGEQGNRSSQRPAMAANGCCVAFESEATNLVPGDGNDRTDVFVYVRALESPTPAPHRQHLPMILKAG